MGPKLQTRILERYCTKNDCEDIKIFSPEFGNPFCCSNSYYRLLYEKDTLAFKKITMLSLTSVGIHMGNAFSISHPYLYYSAEAPIGKLYRQFCPLTEFYIMRPREGVEFRKIE